MDLTHFARSDFFAQDRREWTKGVPAIVSIGDAMNAALTTVEREKPGFRICRVCWRWFAIPPPSRMLKCPACRDKAISKTERMDRWRNWMSATSGSD